MGDGESDLPMDPGWRPSRAGLSWVLAPWLMQVRGRRSTQPVLVMLRSIFLSFVTALILFGVVLAAIGSGTHLGWSSGSAAAAGLVIVGLGLAVQVVAARFLDRPIPCGEPAAVASGYRAKFFVKIACAETAPLFGFVLAFTTSRWWVYLFGLVPAAVGFTLAAPTRAAVEREQHDLWERGCTVDLLAALMQPMPPPRNGSREDGH